MVTGERLLAAVSKHYRAFFSIDEIEQSTCLKALYWVLLFGFFLSFQSWINADWISSSSVTSGSYVCPSYFQSCGDYYLKGLPESYAFVVVFAGLIGLMVTSAAMAALGRWSLAHALLIPLLFFKLAFAGFLTYRAIIEYEYFHVPEVVIFLFSRRKEFFARRMLVWTYFFAATMKLSESWIVGNYFSALTLGLPVFPDAWIPYVTNFTILFEILTPIGLLARSAGIRWSAIIAWTIFHIYSVTLVGLNYPAHCISLLFALFFFRSDTLSGFAPKDWRAAPGWAALLLISVLNAIPWFVPGNRLYTVQGRKFGAQMFDANHQCRSEQTILFKDGKSRVDRWESELSMVRCPPYEWLFHIQQACKKPDVASIAWTFDSSINGGPFYRIIEAQSACSLSYSELGHNDWIRLPEDGAAIVGYPRKNRIGTYAPDPAESVVFPAAESKVSLPTQSFFVENLQGIKIFYWILWSVMAGLLVVEAVWSWFNQHKLAPKGEGC